jgi:hypothetical protein
VKATAVAPKAKKAKKVAKPKVNKTKGTVTATIGGKKVTMTLHQWHALHAAHVAHLKKVAAAKVAKLAGDGGAIELVGPKGYTHGWVKVDGLPADHDLKPGDRIRASGPAFGKAEGTVTKITPQGLIADLHSSSQGPSPGRGIHRSQVTAVRKAGGGLGRVAAQIKPAPGLKGFANDGGRFLELAFAEVLAERVPPGRSEGGQFAPIEAQLGRYDTPDQAARAINAMEAVQRAVVRASILPPPGFEWQAGDRLTAAQPA